MAKTAASESEVGKIHNKITMILNKHLDRTLEMLDNGEDPTIVVNMKDLAVAAKWTEVNGVTAVLEVNEKGSGIQSKLDEIRNRAKGKVVPMIDRDQKVG